MLRQEKSGNPGPWVYRALVVGGAASVQLAAVGRLGQHERLVVPAVFQGRRLNWKSGTKKLKSFFVSALDNLARFENKNIFFYSFKKRSSLLQRWRCSCKFKSRKSVSWNHTYDFLMYNYNASIVVG
jgi:hypothetical protein